MGGRAMHHRGAEPTGTPKRVGFGAKPTLLGGVASVYERIARMAL